MTERATIVSRERSFDIARERLRGVVDGGGGKKTYRWVSHAPIFLLNAVDYFFI